MTFLSGSLSLAAHCALADCELRTGCLAVLLLPGWLPGSLRTGAQPFAWHSLLILYSDPNRLLRLFRGRTEIIGPACA